MQTILITGATSGIGLALSQIYHKQGANLILVGRRPIEALSDPVFTPEVYCQADLAQPDCHLTIDQWLTEQAIDKIDLVIHNAGIGWVGSTEEHSPAEIVEMIQVNLKAPIAITHQLFKRLERASGKVAFVSSVVSQLPLSKFGVYVASKAALDGFARSLAVEWNGRVQVQVLHPGATNTAMHEKVGTDQAVYSKYPSAESVAQKMERSILRNNRHVAIGFGNKIMRGLSLTIPRLLDLGMRQPPSLVMHPQERNRLKPHVVITGGADGIGAAVAQRYGITGQLVTVLDIDKERGHKLIDHLGDGATFLSVDLSQPESIEQAVDQLLELPPITTLVNNAGISAAGRFEFLELDRMLKVIDINLTGAILLTTRLLAEGKLMTGHQQVYLSSLSKYVGYPGAAVYSASKDGLAAFARTMQTAALADGRTTTVFPGPTRTAHARRYSPDNSREEQRMPPEAVAEAIFKGAQAKRRLVFPGAGAKVFAVFGRLAPRLAERAMKRTIYDKL